MEKHRKLTQRDTRPRTADGPGGSGRPPPWTVEGKEVAKAPHGPPKAGMLHGQWHLGQTHRGAHGSPGTRGAISGIHGLTLTGRRRVSGFRSEGKPSTQTSARGGGTSDPSDRGTSGPA
eukprot:5358509-Pyramimonas_sp.AAC.1